MSLLTRESNIFIEFKDLVVNCDIYVVKYIVAMMNRGIKLDFFEALYNEFNNETDEYIEERLRLKFNFNPLLDYVDLSKMKEDINPIEECDKMYNVVLCEHVGVLDELKPTNLHMALVNIINNKDLKHIYVYHREYSPIIHFFINKLFNDSQKVSLVTGNIKDCISDISIDSYFVNDITLLDNIIKKRHNINTIDFVVPDYSCNMIDTGITLDPDLPEPAQDIYEKYNINVRVIKRPI